MLTLSIDQDLAVVHRFDDADTCLLLVGTGPLGAHETRDFPVPGDFATFTGEFVSTSARGVEVLTAFAQGADPSSLGVWTRL